MKCSILYFIVLCCSYVVGNAQQLPLIRATTKNVKIRDGKMFKDNFWVIFPETKPDTYYVDLPRINQRVTFITDSDSISFDVTYGNTYDFIILLNERDSCYTRISANYPIALTKTKTVITDTIPFTMRHNRIYIQGKVNNAEPLLCQFDLGAGGLGMCYLNRKSVKKVALNFDSTITLVNNKGTGKTKMSSSNSFQIGQNQWQDIAFVETNNMNKYEDVILGNGLFLDKYIQVDYDKSIIIISDTMPAIDQTYKKYPMLLENGIKPLFEASFVLAGISYTDWFLFDTGNTGNGSLSYNFLTAHKLYPKFSKILPIGKRTIARNPALFIADNSYSNGTISLDRKYNIATGYTNGGGLIGNKILKNFNFVLDNQLGYIYLKPNSAFR